MIIFRNSVIRFIVGILSLVLCVGLFRSLYSQILRKDAVLERKERLLIEQTRNESLKKRLKEATSSAFVEKQAREKLGLVKEGDTVILLDTSAMKEVESVQNEKQESNWDKWWKLFF